MPVATSDIHFRLATATGPGNSTAPGAAGTSLGGFISNADFTDNVLNNIFPDVTGDENAASNVDYQCVFCYNANASAISLLNAILWLVSEVAGGVSLALGVDTTAASALASASAQSLTIANKNTAPAGVSFSTATTKAAGSAMGTIPAGQVKAFWIRRTASNTTAVNSDGGTFRVEGDTTA